MRIDDDGVPRLEGLGVALLRLSAFAAAGVMVALVASIFMAAVQIAPLVGERESLDAAQLAVLFFGPLAGILTLAFIVTLALTRPVSMAVPSRRRTARGTALAYAILGAALALWFRPLAWGWAVALIGAVLALSSWLVLRRAERQRGGG